MRIYLAGYYSAGGKTTAGETTENLQITRDLEYDYVLESYHYIGKGSRVVPYLREQGKTVFLDSGAFSMFTQGIEVDLKEYARFIEENRDIIHIASNLDEIGQGKEEESYRNQKTLESYLKPAGLSICPVHHARDHSDWLRRYLDEGYEYIFLGGMVPEQTPYLRRWLDELWGTILTHSDGRPKVKVHGFGLTTTELMFRYPWYSVDSTSWVMSSRFGGIFVDLPQPDGSVRDVKIMISSESPSRHDFGRHFTTLDPESQAVIRRRIEELGYDVDGLASLYGWRDHFNVCYFNRAMARRVDRFVQQQDTLSLF